jgi:hypothetical protein
MAYEISWQDYLHDEEHSRLKEKQDQQAREKASYDKTDHGELAVLAARISVRVFSIYGKLFCAN